MDLPGAADPNPSPHPQPLICFTPPSFSWQILSYPAPCTSNPRSCLPPRLGLVVLRVPGTWWWPRCAGEQFVRWLGPLWGEMTHLETHRCLLPGGCVQLACRRAGPWCRVACHVKVTAWSPACFLGSAHDHPPTLSCQDPSLRDEVPSLCLRADFSHHLVYLCVGCRHVELGCDLRLCCAVLR